MVHTLSSTALNDEIIRKVLIDRLNKRPPQPKKILEELSIHNRNAIADVVAFYNEMHCFEIKGETDSVRRVLKQAKYYDLSFPKISLVTTNNHLNWASSNLPTHWGIIIAYQDSLSSKVKLRYFRKAFKNPFFEKNKAYLMLWKNELLDISAQFSGFKRKNTREEISEMLSKNMTKKGTLESIQDTLIARKRLTD